MIKKCCLLLMLLFLGGCQTKITTSEKQNLIDNYVATVKNLDFDKIQDYGNTTVKIAVKETTKIEQNLVLEEALNSLELTLLEENGEDYVVVKNYSLQELMEKAIIVTPIIEGIDISKNVASNEQKKIEFKNKMHEIKASLNIKETKIKVKFIKDDKDVKFDFNDAETVKLLNATLGA